MRNKHIKEVLYFFRVYNMKASTLKKLLNFFGRAAGVMLREQPY